MSHKTTKKQLRTLEHHKATVQAGVSQHVTEECQQLNYNKAIRAGIIRVAPEDVSLADIQV